MRGCGLFIKYHRTNTYRQTTTFTPTGSSHMTCPKTQWQVRHLITPDICETLIPFDSYCSSEPDRLSVLWYVLSIRCDNKAFKKLMSNFGSSRSEESCSAVVELLERVTRLQKELELKESQEEIDMDQVQTTTDLHHTRVGCCSMPCPGPAGNCSLWTMFALHHSHFVAVCMLLSQIREGWWRLLWKWRASKQPVAWSCSFHLTKPPKTAPEPPSVRVCVCLQLFLTGANHRDTPLLSHMTISWIKALLLQSSSIFTTKEDRQKGNRDVMCSQNVLALREEKLKPNNVLTVRLCLCAGCVGWDLCPSICYDVKVHCRDFQQFWQANLQDVGWKLNLTSTFDIHLHWVYL